MFIGDQFIAVARGEHMNIIQSALRPYSRAHGLFDSEMSLPELLGEVMTRAGIGLILAAGDGEIVYANHLANALLRANDGLRCERNSLTLQGFASSKKLQPLIVAASRHRDEWAQGGTMILRGEDAAPPLVVHIIPLGENFGEDPAAETRPAAGILIVDCQQAPAARIGAFARLFALTRAETRVAAQLFSGEGIRKVASTLNIALSTAQSHLKHILEKTATHRQAELVKLFYQVTLPRGVVRNAVNTALDEAAGGREPDSASGQRAFGQNRGRPQSKGAIPLPRTAFPSVEKSRRQSPAQPGISPQA
jgi:DNA-binding CsgD family transcriptional regulator